MKEKVTTASSVVVNTNIMKTTNALVEKHDGWSAYDNRKLKRRIGDQSINCISHNENVVDDYA